MAPVSISCEAGLLFRRQKLLMCRISVYIVLLNHSFLGHNIVLPYLFYFSLYYCAHVSVELECRLKQGYNSPPSLSGSSCHSSSSGGYTFCIFRCTRFNFSVSIFVYRTKQNHTVPSTVHSILLLVLGISSRELPSG